MCTGRPRRADPWHWSLHAISAGRRWQRCRGHTSHHTVIRVSKARQGTWSCPCRSPHKRCCPIYFSGPLPVHRWCAHDDLIYKLCNGRVYARTGVYATVDSTNDRTGTVRSYRTIRTILRPVQFKSRFHSLFIVMSRMSKVWKFLSLNNPCTYTRYTIVYAYMDACMQFTNMEVQVLVIKCDSWYWSYYSFITYAHVLWIALCNLIKRRPHIMIHETIIINK